MCTVPGVDFLHPTCPTCATELAHNTAGTLDTWTCPQGHGAGLTVTEAYTHIQDDEIHRAWDAARSGTPGPRKCPICGRQMVVVDLAYDPDESAEVAPGSPSEALDVCTEDQLIWFDPGEYEALPADVPNPEPSPEELARIAAIRQAFGESVVAAAHAREDRTLTEHLYRHLAGHPYVNRVAQGLWL